MVICNKDCFNCQLPDCQYDGVTQAEFELSNELDSENKYLKLDKKLQRQRNAGQRYRATHRQQERERNQANYLVLKHDENRRAKRREYVRNYKKRLRERQAG